MAAAVDRIQDWPEYWEPYVREYYQGLATVGEVAARHGLDPQKLAHFVRERRLVTANHVIKAGMAKGDSENDNDRSPDEWRLLVEDYESGSVPFATYARERGVYVKAFKVWIDRVRRERESAARKAAKEAAAAAAAAPKPVQTTVAPPPPPPPPAEESPVPVRKFRFYSKSEKTEILQQVIASGLTVPVWSDRNNFNSATLYNWFRELKVPKPISGYGKNARANGGRALPPERAPKPMPMRTAPNAGIKKTLAERSPPPPSPPRSPRPAAAQEPALTLRLGDTELSFGQAPSPEYLAQLAKAFKG